MERSSGVLLHISSLPSPYGIGTLGKEAYRFADWLHKAGQRYWQVLPMGQTGFGDSPYQSVSVFAGNPYFIDLDLLQEDGLLPAELLEELSKREKKQDPRKVDYGNVYSTRYHILRLAFSAGYARDQEKVQAFFEKNKDWLADYALFMACKRYFGMKPYSMWEDRSIAEHTKEGVEKYTEFLREDIQFFIYIQYLFFTQYQALLDYLHGFGISVIGDLPVYVASDSSDAWAHPENYLLDQENRPTWVAGVPPDYFSASGQLWGNPIYNWAHMKKDGYAWWLKRMELASRMYDTVRIDHFRGLSSYWCIPYGDKTAVNGHWEKGPGMDLVEKLQKSFPGTQIIAEDLGVLSEDVEQLLSDSGLPGMRVLQFAFYHGEHSTYMPHAYVENTVCYTGTHDNDTLAGYIDSLKEQDLAYAKRYMGLNKEEGYCWGILRTGMASVAKLFVAQMQDYLLLDSENRMNRPGTSSGNWMFRLLPGECTDELAEKIRQMTVLYQR